MALAAVPSNWGRRNGHLWMAVIFLLALLHAHSAACEEGEVDYSKMRVKQLKKLLSERGVECDACVEKDDLLARVKESIHLPVLSEEELEIRSAKKAGKDDTINEREFNAKDWDKLDDSARDAKLQELLDKLKLGGLGENIKVFNPKDFKDMKDIKDSVDHSGRFKDGKRSEL